MDLTTFDILLSPAGQEALRAAALLEPDLTTFPACFRRLARSYPTELARAALETTLLRRRAQGKLTRAEEMYFTREALEQASGAVVAAHRAARFSSFAAVADFCCGIGADTLALAARVAHVVAVDADPLRLAMARANLSCHGLADRATLRCGDVLAEKIEGVEAAFCDPDRRPDGRRVLSLARCSPPVEQLVKVWLPRLAGLGVKLAPGSSWAELRHFDGEVEMISHQGEMKECVLWLGELASAARRATVLPGPHTLAADAPAPAAPPERPRAYLYDPDPAILRSGLVTTLAELLGASQIDPETALLTADQLAATPFARAYRVEDALPFHLKRLAGVLRARGVGRITVLRRGSPVDPVELTRRLKLSGAEDRTIVLTRIMGQPSVVIAQPLAPAPPP